ncbi:37S ribosomal protein mrp4, mitochondrial [Schizosaccharomyces pombe]|uniref:Small ribosomal subunit protein uS2m n=1 Tax=Schizosaccharomyces pombe (strain 972 / ATCC 24843) TaxID=284812 RepID=RT04_SCHPO|nr:putative mitochondrial ribosomal protein subunit S2 [Schizosaccharomyces pombe]O13970.2 RecName: Full=Small ribosomal subunit protein uS2m; AltName: Full=37S ribosomal protein mrp4, mitochondrial; Flags: Precursor [Schizosaccharomyces pombe 972h-]CAB11267.1 mitochondrial ribosomal protein subunit S2 (predicted) [Schizosaccharomyces pombe]|eukprot:NP_594035.1 putative mitochondrial ribosomal protein subunit S2 [Schizosaccharomyces pombe]
MLSRKLSPEQLVARRLKIRDWNHKIGAVVAPHYSPTLSIRNPAPPSQLSLPLLLSSGAHLGHSTSIWNPYTQPFIYGKREGIHIISLDQTMVYLRRAISVVRSIAKENGIILFIGTRNGQKDSVVAAAKRARGYHIFDRWLPGLLTNAREVQGKLGGSILCKDNRGKLIQTDKKPSYVFPDLMVILNPLENKSACLEAQKTHVPTIGIIDTDADPRMVTYPIPANDDSLRCTDLIAGLLSRVAEQEYQKANQAFEKDKFTLPL